MLGLLDHSINCSPNVKGRVRALKGILHLKDLVKGLKRMGVNIPISCAPMLDQNREMGQVV